MEPARLAASKPQAASSSKQATSPAGPLAGPRATRVPESGKNRHAIWDGVGTTNNHLWTRKARVPAAKVLHAPEWPCPGRAPGGAPSGPKITKNGPWCLPGGPQKVPLSKLMDKINLGTFWVAFSLSLDPRGPKTVSVGPKMGSFGPRMCPSGLKLKNGRISG